jgi:hypothetical protein
MTGCRCERSVDGCGLYSASLDPSLTLDRCTYLDTEAVRSAARRRVLVHRYESVTCSYLTALMGGVLTDMMNICICGIVT